MREQGWYTKNRVKDRGNKKKVIKKKVIIYYRKEFAYTRQVLKEYNIIRY